MKLPSNILVLDATTGPLPKLSGNAKASAGTRKRVAAYTASRKAARSIAVGKTATKKGVADPVQVGVWNLGEWLGYLPQWLETLNKKQDRYRFYMVEAMVPLGLVLEPAGVIAWCKREGIDLNDGEVDAPHTIENEFRTVAERLRCSLQVPTTTGTSGLDYMVGITPGMVAGVDATFYWNHFSSGDKRTLLASLFDFHRYAKESDVPISHFVMGVVIAQLLEVQFRHLHLGFHEENRGCLFDYNGDRESLKKSIARMQIEASCMKHIPADFQPAVKAILAAIKKFK